MTGGTELIYDNLAPLQVLSRVKEVRLIKYLLRSKEYPTLVASIFNIILNLEKGPIKLQQSTKKKQRRLTRLLKYKSKKNQLKALIDNCKELRFYINPGLQYLSKEEEKEEEEEEEKEEEKDKRQK
jgi:hypothetical protein